MSYYGDLRDNNDDGNAVEGLVHCIVGICVVMIIIVAIVKHGG